MKLLTQELEEKFKQYPLGSQDGKMGNAELIAKFFNPTGVGTWYITEGNRLENGDYEMFGYCHLGDDEFAEFGSILLSELENIELPLGLSIEQDLYVPKRTDLMTAMIRDGMRVPDFIKNNYIASDRYNFESIIILQPNLTDEEKSKVVNDYKEYFKKISDQEVEVDDRGKRKLAYQIKDNTEGYFISYYFDAKEHDISDLEKQYRLDDNVIKFMTIKVS